MKISFIIPTLNRPDELEKLLKSFAIQSHLPDEIIIVDQGEKALNFSNLTVKLFKVDFKSLTKAKNFGVEKSTGDIIGFLDDDIILDKDYIKNIINFFESHPAALGVQGVITDFEIGHTKKVGGNKIVYKIYNLLAKVFLLNNSSSKNKLLLSGRNQYASQVKNLINCEWLSGIGNYRKEVFKEFSFDENLTGYCLGEDKLFSYPIFEKYPNGLFADPSIKCEHHHATAGRPQNKDWVTMKISYTYYLWNKLFRKKGIKAFASYWWANLGDVKIVWLSFLLRQNSFKFFLWHVQGYWNLLWKK